MSDFKSLIQCETEAEFDSRWEKFLVEWEKYPAWVRYVSSEWLPKKTRWSYAWRKVRHNLNNWSYSE